MRRLTVSAILILTLLAACTPQRQPVDTFYGQTPAQAKAAAMLRAAEVGGQHYVVAPTGSMEPFLAAGDFLVVQPIPYDAITPGILANYQARWLPGSSPTVTHWVAARSGDEWIMDGQANGAYERGDGQRMGRAEFRGQVIAIYTTRAPR